jgi:hypothetical protein
MEEPREAAAAMRDRPAGFDAAGRDSSPDLVGAVPARHPAAPGAESRAPLRRRGAAAA